MADKTMFAMIDGDKTPRPKGQDVRPKVFEGKPFICSISGIYNIRTQQRVYKREYKIRITAVQFEALRFRSITTFSNSDLERFGFFFSCD